jgi:hypothetical protein
MDEVIPMDYRPCSFLVSGIDRERLEDLLAICHPPTGVYWIQFLDRTAHVICRHEDLPTLKAALRLSGGKVDEHGPADPPTVTPL